MFSHGGCRVAFSQAGSFWRLGTVWTSSCSARSRKRSFCRSCRKKSREIRAQVSLKYSERTDTIPDCTSISKVYDVLAYDRSRRILTAVEMARMKKDVSVDLHNLGVSVTG